MENKNYLDGEMTDVVSTANINAADQDIVLAPDPAEKESEMKIIDPVIPANAEDIAADAVMLKETEASIKVEEAPAKAARVNEIPELRGENRKVFRMSDGTEQAVFYAEPIHVFDDETQRFEAADTALTEKEGSFVSGKTRFTAEFSKDESNDELFHITDGAHRVTVLAAKAGKNKQAAVATLKKAAVEEISATADQITDQVIFEKAAEGADFIYSLTGNGVKEDIVIREKADVYRYSFLLRTENVVAEFCEDEKRIAFKDVETGEEVFHIPSPFMNDAAGNLSAAVSYDVRTLDSGDIFLTVTADSEWINAEERAFPVVIDPQIKVGGSGSMITYSWVDGKMSSASTHTVGTSDSGDGNCNINRMYMKLNMPELPCNPRIKKAELKFFQSSGSAQCGGCPKLGLYQVHEGIVTGTCTPVASSDLIDYNTMKAGHCEDGEVISYTFDITKLIDAADKGETSYANLVLKMVDESSLHSDNVVLYGSTYSISNAPQLVMTYESSYGVNTSYRTHTHELGRFGQGSIDLACGNLMLESEDFAWAGNRMPVTLKHLYNSALCNYQYTANSGIRLNTASFDSMKLGYGFKLNVMQSMVPASFQHEGTAYTGYVYIGENGDEIYFKESTKTCLCNNSQCHNLYEDVNGSEMLYDPETKIITYGNISYSFDASGRLIKITDGHKNSMVITYTSGKITSVTDGAGRVFGFGYNASGFLTSITAPDGTNVLYTYSGDLLTSVTYPSGKKAEIIYSSNSSNKPSQIILSDNGTNVYKVIYIYSGDRVAHVTECGFDNGTAVIGAATAYSYSAASRRTVATITEQKDDGENTNNVIKTVYTFDDDGNIVSEYVYSQDTGNVGSGGDGSGINPHSGDGGAGVVSNINNLLVNHNFETLDSWTGMENNGEDLKISNYAYEPYAKFGRKLLRMHSNNSDCTENGVYQLTDSLPKGDYTFSVYARILSAFSGTENPGAYIRVTTASGTVLAESEHICAYNTEYIRLAVPFTISAAQSVKVQILVDGKGTVYADAAQLENNAFANAYNMLENGNFERGTSGWTCSTGVSSFVGTSFNMNKSLYMSGDLNASRYASQKVIVKTNRSTRKTFTLSGWAKGYGIVNRERDYAQAPQFRLRAVVKYYDTYYKEYGTETYTADFSPCTEEWQLASVQFAKEKFRTVQDITVYCDYSYNFGKVYFDDIQLVRDSIETNLSVSDFVIESTVVDNNDSDGEDITADNSPAFSEVTDEFGNTLTETAFTDGEFGTVYRSFGFNTDNGQLTGDDAGNNLVRETDARGNNTTYTVDSETSRNEEITDRLGNKTAYEYDASGRTTKVTNKKADGTETANVSYAYDAFDNMTEIARGDGMKYALAYNVFHNLESIGVDGKTDKLIRYDYKNGNGRLKQITYANGDKMKVTYNSIGQMIAEKWYDASDTLTAHYKYVYDGQGNIVRSIDILAKIEYTYSYEGGHIIRAAESAITLNGEVVIGKTLVNSILYTYDSEGRLTKKRVIPANYSEQVVYYETNDGNTVVKFSAGGRTVTSHSKTDSFGRKVFDELQLGTGFVSRQFHYHSGNVTEEHKANEKLKSSPTTQLVSQIVLSGGRTISYEYDAEERITKVADSVDGVTEYTYDELGQLLTEKHNGEAVNTMEYDNYGNIKSKNGIAYTYGDGVWKDLLTKVGEQTISYDKQGNPTSYLGHTLTWKKGRQLKSFDNISYTYNANGIRTSKTVNGVKHTYTLDGTKILRETWDGNTLIPMYDNEDSVCGIIYNDEPYYFQKNLQGDIIAIVDKDTKEIARYSYDAWGSCTIAQDISDTGIAALNPFRYRGYYYDNEIGMYYLQSRYYNSTIGRFFTADEMLNLEILLGLNIYLYCDNCPVIYTDTTGFGKTYCIYYDNPGSGFKEQARNSPYYTLKNAYLRSVKKIKDFQNIWNLMTGTIDYIYLYLHGGTGLLYFKGETMNISQIRKLSHKKVKYGIYLFSCHGGDGKEGNNVAWEFAKLTNSPVIACTGGVSFSKIGKYFYPRKAFDLGGFYSFYYQKKYIWWGPVVAKRKINTL